MLLFQQNSHVVFIFDLVRDLGESFSQYRTEFSRQLVESPSQPGHLLVLLLDQSVLFATLGFERLLVLLVLDSNCLDGLLSFRHVLLELCLHLLELPLHFQQNVVPVRSFCVSGSLALPQLDFSLFYSSLVLR